MKRVSKKLREPAPKCLGDIFKGKPICLDVTLWAKMEDIFLSILVYNTGINAIPAKIVTTIGAGPFCRPCGMEVTDRFRCHAKVPFPCLLMR